VPHYRFAREAVDAVKHTVAAKNDRITVVHDDFDA
jgi:hypothetical protein